MAALLGLTLDCARPAELAAFWAVALGYVEPKPPAGFDSWPDWFRELEVPESEWDDGAYLVDPDGVGPSLSLLKVPEAKVAKNRLHLDLKVSGGRQQSATVRRERMLATVEQLIEIGARVQQEIELGGALDHVIMTDPEGNEFCVV